VAGYLERSIEGRVAVVTGAASGIGRATAILMAEQGASVAIFDLQRESVMAVADEITSEGGTARGWVVDVTDSAAAASAVSEVSSTLGPISILVNCAGMALICPIESEKYEAAWDRALAVHLTGTMRMIRLCLGDLVRSGAGRVVNVSSTEGHGGTAGTSPYSVAKHGVIGLTRSFAVELAPRGVLVNCVSPGPIHTGVTSRIPEKDKTRFAQRYVPVGRYGEPREVAHMILSLCLPASSYVTGAVLPVDGGMLAQLQPPAIRNSSPTVGQ
jgi:3-oxoacyl-[acyl-carrier protein] reductase